MKNNCPTCEGTGKMEITMTVYGETGSNASTIDCIDCNGNPMSEEDATKLVALKEYQESLWCTCANPSEDATYVADGVSDDCEKHHWLCNDCNKIYQIG